MDVDVTKLKEAAAAAAVRHIESGMVVGLGSGTTAMHALRQLAQLLHDGQLHDIVGVPTSVVVEGEAQRLGIPLTSFADHPIIDVTIDGADEVDPELNVIKGGGGALLREKIVAQASRREIIIVDQSKLSPALGTHWAVPVEVVPFGWQTQVRFLESLSARVKLRLSGNGRPFMTDQGNFILDANFGPINHLSRLASQIKMRAGVVEHGLFLGMATDVIVASPDGIRHLKRSEPGIRGKTSEVELGA